MKSKVIEFRNHLVEVIYTTSDAEKGDREHPDYAEKHTIERIEYEGVDIYDFISIPAEVEIEEMLD